MPLLSNTGDSASIAADRLENTAIMLVNELNNWSAACDAGSVNAHTFITQFMLNRLIPTRNTWTVLRAITGVETAVRNRWPGKFANDAAATTLLSDIETGMTALIDWLATNIQGSLTNGSGYVEVIKIEANAVTLRQITAGASLTALKSQMTTLKNLIIG